MTENEVGMVFFVLMSTISVTSLAASIDAAILGQRALLISFGFLFVVSGFVASSVWAAL